MPSYTHRMPRSAIAQLFAGGQSLVSASSAKALTLPLLVVSSLLAGCQSTA